MSSKDIVIAAAGSELAVTPIQYVGGKVVSITPSVSNNTTISLTNLTGGLSSEVQTGDVVIVSYVIGDTGEAYRNPNVTSNTYTALATLFSNDGSETSLYSGYKVMEATPDTSVTVTPTTATGRGGVVAIQAYRYCDSNFPIQQPANTAIILDTVRPTPPTITPWDALSVAVIVGAGAHTRGNIAYTTTGLTSFISSGSTNTTTDASIGMGFREINFGSYSPSRFDFASTDSNLFSSAALSVALKPKPDTVIPTFISYRAGGSTTGNTITLVKPTDVQENDLLLLTISFETSTATINSVPSGFTLVRSDGKAGSSITFTYKKIATANEPASYAITQNSSTINFSCVISVFRNANTINTLGQAASTSTSTSTSVNAKTMTPTVGGLAVSIYMSESSGTLLETPPENTTQLVSFSGASTGCSQFLFSAIAGPYFETPQRTLIAKTVGSSPAYVTAFQIQLTKE